jgi:hypothetical protein
MDGSAGATLFRFPPPQMSSLTSPFRQIVASGRVQVVCPHHSLPQRCKDTVCVLVDVRLDLSDVFPELGRFQRPLVSRNDERMTSPRNVVPAETEPVDAGPLEVGRV